MKTISVQMSDVEYDNFGLSKDRFFFSEIVDLIERYVMRKSSVTIDDKLEKLKKEEKSWLYYELEGAFADVRLMMDGKKKKKTLDELIDELRNSTH